LDLVIGAPRTRKNKSPQRSTFASSVARFVHDGINAGTRAVRRGHQPHPVARPVLVSNKLPPAPGRPLLLLLVPRNPRRRCGHENGLLPTMAPGRGRPISSPTLELHPPGPHRPRNSLGPASAKHVPWDRPNVCFRYTCPAARSPND